MYPLKCGDSTIAASAAQSVIIPYSIHRVLVFPLSLTKMNGETPPDPTRPGDSRPQRSRKGCWTCRKRHKKCDEARPFCQRCAQGNFDCEGYDVRLTWGNSDAPPARSGIVLKPLRLSRGMKRSPRRRGPRKGITRESGDGSGMGESHLDSDEMDLMYFQYQDDVRAASEYPWDQETEAILMEECQCTINSFLTYFKSLVAIPRPVN
jgi:hypothetical protein